MFIIHVELSTGRVNSYSQPVWDSHVRLYISALYLELEVVIIDGTLSTKKGLYSLLFQSLALNSRPLYRESIDISTSR